MLVCLVSLASWGTDQEHRAGSFTVRKSQIPEEQLMAIKALIQSQVSLGKQDGNVWNILLAKYRSHIQAYTQKKSFDRYYLSFD